MTHIGGVVLCVVGAVYVPAIVGLGTTVAATESHCDVIAPRKLMIEAYTSTEGQVAAAVDGIIDSTVDDSLTIGGVLTAAGTFTLTIGSIEIAPDGDRFLYLEIVAGIETEVFVSAPGLVAAQDVAARHETLAAGATPVVGIIPVEGGVEVVLPVLVGILGLQVKST